jgi:hypothetical protein
MSVSPGERARDRQRGSAMVLTMVIITALLSGSAVLVSLQITAGRSTELTRSGLSAIYCAEAGLTAARPAIAANYPQWNASLGATSQPAWLSNTAFSHDLDNDGVDDFAITIRDNDDEVAPAANDLAHDLDLKVFLVSTCIKYPDTPKEVTELVEYQVGGAPCYGAQVGGCIGRGNAN